MGESSESEPFLPFGSCGSEWLLVLVTKWKQLEEEFLSEAIDLGFLLSRDVGLNAICMCSSDSSVCRDPMKGHAALLMRSFRSVTWVITSYMLILSLKRQRNLRKERWDVQGNL